MNLRDLKTFVATQMTNQLADCGINLDQIEQVKIYDSKISSNNLVWEFKVGNHCYSYIKQKIYQWINNQIIVCYMNDNLDRDLSIEVTGNGKGMIANGDMTENKNFENERYLYREADVYTPHSFRKPKLDEMGYFTDNMEAFDNLKDPDLYYVYGELTDYDEDYEHRYCCESEWEDYWETDYITEKYAFYIPESSIPQEKQDWYRSHAINMI